MKYELLETLEEFLLIPEIEINIRTPNQSYTAILRYFEPNTERNIINLVLTPSDVKTYSSLACLYNNKNLTRIVFDKITYQLNKELENLKEERKNLERKL